jgi:osmotically inducible lipoprotein OsmB
MPQFAALLWAIMSGSHAMHVRTLIASAAVLSLGLGLTACNSPGERAVGGALIGGGSGALIGGALGGRRGALAGAGIGAAGGAIIGASTTPQPVYRDPGYGEPVYADRGYYRQPRRTGCPYGAEQDEYGNVYCR